MSTDQAAIAVSLGIAVGIVGTIAGAEIWYRARQRRLARSLHPEERAILRARADLGG